jgi:hypothetical protein
MRPGRILLIAVLACGSLAHADSLYVPYVRAGGGPGIPYWRSRLSMFNTGQVLAKAHILGIYGGGSTLYDTNTCETGNGAAIPNAGHRVGECINQLPNGGVAFLEVAPDPGVLIQADIYRSLEYADLCVSPGVTEVPLARWPLPIFHGAFTASSTVTTGEISLGNPRSINPCVPADREYLRRVNVTLFNAGTAPAAFQVTVYLYEGAIVLYSRSVSVPPKDVTQLNGIQNEITLSPYTGDPEVRIWITVSADQPFLAYSSAIYNAAPAGQPSFEVFEVQAPHLTTQTTP